MSRHKPCTCLLCKPVDGKRGHPIYGYDLDAVPHQLCVVCNAPIGAEPYVEDLWLARFGDIMFVHQRCESAHRAAERKRMEAKWHALNATHHSHTRGAHP